MDHPALSRGVRPRPLREASFAEFPAVVHPEWTERYSWLVQGTTTAREPDGGEPERAVPAGTAFDLGLFGNASTAGAVFGRWDRLAGWTGARTLAHARQVHGRGLRWHGDGGPGLVLAPPCDAHATRRPGTVLTVALADCVPAFLVDPRRRAVALAHCGWRGTAAGVLEAAIDALRGRTDTREEDLRLHLGPAICGDCYEVGPEVFEALGADRPARPEPIDLRAALAERALERGVRSDHITVSEHCTRCGDVPFFSHRRGDAGRHLAFLGLRACA